MNVQDDGVEPHGIATLNEQMPTSNGILNLPVAHLERWIRKAPATLTTVNQLLLFVRYLKPDCCQKVCTNRWHQSLALGNHGYVERSCFAHDRRLRTAIDILRFWKGVCLTFRIKQLFCHFCYNLVVSHGPGIQSQLLPGMFMVTKQDLNVLDYNLLILIWFTGSLGWREGNRFVFSGQT